MSMQKVLPGSQTIAAHVADQCKQLYSALPTALQAVLGLAQRLIDAALTKRKVGKSTSWPAEPVAPKSEGPPETTGPAPLPLLTQPSAIEDFEGLKSSAPATSDTASALAKSAPKLASIEIYEVMVTDDHLLIWGSGLVSGSDQAAELYAHVEFWSEAGTASPQELLNTAATKPLKAFVFWNEEEGEGALTIERFEVPPREIVLEARRPGYQSAFWGLPEDWNSEELLATASRNSDLEAAKGSYDATGSPPVSPRASAEEHEAWLASVCEQDEWTPLPEELGRLVELLQSGKEVLQREAAVAIRKAAITDANNIILANAGAITLLVDLLESTSALVQASAARTVLKLAEINIHLVRLVEDGAILSLIKILLSSSESVQQDLVGEVVAPADFDLQQISLGTATAIPSLVYLLQSSSPGVQALATLAISAILEAAEQDCVAVVMPDGAAATIAQLLLSEVEGVKCSAAVAVMSMSKSTENRAKLIEAGAIPLLVRALRGSLYWVCLYAAGAVRYLADSEANRMSLAEAGVAPALVQLLEYGSGPVQVHAAAAASNLAFSETNRAGLVQAGIILPLIKILESSTEQVQIEAARAVRNMAADESDRTKLTEAGAIPPLVQLLESDSSPLQAMSAAALCHIAVDDVNRVRLAASGALGPLVQLLQSSSPWVQAEAAGAIRNLAADPANQVSLAKAGAIPPLVQLLQSPAEEVQASAAGAVQNLALDAANKRSLCATGAARPLVQLLQSVSEGVQYSAAWAIRSLAVEEDNRDGLGKAGAVPPLVQLIHSRQYFMREPAIEAVALLAAHDPTSASLVSCYAIPVLHELLESEIEQEKVLATAALEHLSEDVDLPLEEANLKDVTGRAAPSAHQVIEHLPEDAELDRSADVPSPASEGPSKEEFIELSATEFSSDDSTDPALHSSPDEGADSPTSVPLGKKEGPAGAEAHAKSFIAS